MKAGLSVETIKKHNISIRGEALEPVCILGLLFGMRRSEVLDLHRSDIDLEKQTIVLSCTMTQCKNTGRAKY